MEKKMENCENAIDKRQISSNEAIGVAGFVPGRTPIIAAQPDEIKYSALTDDLEKKSFIPPKPPSNPLDEGFVPPKPPTRPANIDGGYVPSKPPTPPVPPSSSA